MLTDLTAAVLGAKQRQRRASKAGLGSNGKSASPDPYAAPGKPCSLENHTARQQQFALQRKAGELLPSHAVCSCGRRRRKDFTSLPIMRGETGKAFVGGVQRCGSIWDCPICAAKIAETRRVETIKGLKTWRADGGQVSMLTLTLPHTKGQALVDVLEAITGCTRYINSGKYAMSKLLARYGYTGQIRALEVTHGGNGWHPHLHVLVLHREDVPQVVIDVIKARWESAAIKNGWAAPGWHVGATWQDGTHAANYVNKAGTWGLAEEVTKAHLKSAGRGGRTPSALLLAATLGDKKAAALFAEYGEAFKGKRQMFWSRGLKDLLGVNDVSDEEIIDTDQEGQEATAELIGEVAADLWRLVCKFEKRAELLRAAEAWGQAGIDCICSELHDRYWKEHKPVIQV